MIVSVHIPKTGGSSFHEILKENYQGKLLLDYAGVPLTKSTEERIRLASENHVNAITISATHDCVHGHFMPLKYAPPNHDNKFLVWFRDPVERVVSRYFYAIRMQPELWISKLTLEEFAKDGRHLNNIYEKYLSGFSLYKFDFIGITEYYRTSLDILEQSMNMKIPRHETPHTNFNQEKKSSRYNIDDKITKSIIKSNTNDYDIYQEALRIFNKNKSNL